MKWLINGRICTSSDKKYLINWQNSGASSLEVRFRQLIEPYWKNSLVLFQCRIPCSLLRIDFLNVNKRIAIEVNGPQHNTFNKHFHNNSRAKFLSSIKRDMAKLLICEQNNISLFELEENDLNSFFEKYIKTGIL